MLSIASMFVGTFGIAMGVFWLAMSVVDFMRGAYWHAISAGIAFGCHAAIGGGVIIAGIL